MSDNTTTISIDALNTTVEFDLDLITCPVCTNPFDADFVTFGCDHSFCSACEVELGNKCAMCRTENSGVGRQNAWVKAAVVTAPRTLPCGEKVEGYFAAEDHTAACMACAKIKIRDLVTECKQFQSDRDSVTTELQAVASELGAVQQQAVAYKDMYDVVRADADRYKAAYNSRRVHINHVLAQNAGLKRDLQNFQAEQIRETQQDEDQELAALRTNADSGAGAQPVIQREHNRALRLVKLSMAKNDEFTQRLRDKTQELDDCKQRLGAKTRELDDVQRDLTARTEELDAVQRDLTARTEEDEDEDDEASVRHTNKRSRVTSSPTSPPLSPDLMRLPVGRRLF